MLEIKNLTKKFAKVKAVNDVSFYLREQETLGIVGESGCGKTTIARTIMKLYQRDGGEIILYKRNDFSTKELYQTIQIVFQNPFESLDERHTVESLMFESLFLLGRMSKDQKRSYTVELLKKVGLDSGCLARYPHQLSGGQRQRVCIARALAPKPQIIILDEPTSALDAKTASNILVLLKDLQQKLGLAYIFISHDLKLVRKISDSVMVMRNGKVIEEGITEEIWNNPAQQYTKDLIAASQHKLV